MIGRMIMPAGYFMPFKSFECDLLCQFSNLLDAEFVYIPERDFHRSCFRRKIQLLNITEHVKSNINCPICRSAEVREVDKSAAAGIEASIFFACSRTGIRM